MGVLQRVKKLASEKSMTIAELERKLDFSQGSVSRWNKQSPSSDRLKKVADYFDVSTDYLIGRTDKKYWDLSERESSDIAQQVEDIINGMEDGGAADMQFYGEPLDDEGKEKLAIALKMALELNKQEAKKKFTRKDYRK
ncbi:helix-turn-helix transcriptional regulator [Listeria grandensis]|uniref:Helix-turn-helix transcriptional regulator n=1 Tax=Listeria grandensis TaxID=1494963 RepID=A0A7X0Y536_9LIST|nr:helix-turn-helix transcriptional regulator [Listeria grandensis]MBC1937146.1 helix-turn-helix transcriptional regulator [Listeria grandensis]